MPDDEPPAAGRRPVQGFEAAWIVHSAFNLRRGNMRRFVFSFAMLAIASCLPVAAYADQQQDKQIAQTVIQRLQKEKETGKLKGFSIDLQVENGTLWLSGRVTSKEQQAAALDVARRVPGVKQVVNDLSVGAPPPPRATNQLVAQSTVG